MKRTYCLEGFKVITQFYFEFRARVTDFIVKGCWEHLASLDRIDTQLTSETLLYVYTHTHTRVCSVTASDFRRAWQGIWQSSWESFTSLLFTTTL